MVEAAGVEPASAMESPKYLRVYSAIMSRQGNCGQTRYHPRQSQHGFAGRAWDAHARLSCCRRSGPPSRCQGRNAWLFFKPRVL